MKNTLTAMNKVTKQYFQNLTAEQLTAIIAGRINFMQMRRKTLMAKHGRYRFKNVNSPVFDNQLEWLQAEPVTVEKAVWVWNACADYLDYCNKLKKAGQVA
ncbi:hypothetical protein [uncultured Limosilactobacillus sp.]|uniref:hypothetical protein n=1 Tax=uncultured Limosilactobacillus sp. TaxID=2837629 RepID=UPI0025D2101A|nr:hypothetical protein [uncultured Limosilactobacillus sp.]